MLYDGIGHVQRELAMPGLLAVGHDALIHHAGSVERHLVPGQARALRQVGHRRQEVRIGIAYLLHRGVVGRGDFQPCGLGNLAQQVLGKDAAPVGGVDGGQGGNIGGHAAVGDGGPAVQPALGVGDDVHLPAAGLLHDLPDALRQLLPAALSCFSP